MGDDFEFARPGLGIRSYWGATTRVRGLGALLGLARLRPQGPVAFLSVSLHAHPAVCAEAEVQTTGPSLKESSPFWHLFG